MIERGSAPNGFVDVAVGMRALRALPARSLRLVREQDAPAAPFTPAASLPPRGAARVHVVTEPGDVSELIRRFQEGDKSAFTELFLRYRCDVTRLVSRMLPSPADAEDVIQEVFLQVHRSLSEFRGQSKFTTWLHRVTVNVVLMTRRAARSRPVLVDESLSGAAADRSMLPDEDAARMQRVAAFRRLLDRLPEKKRTVYVLHDLEGLSPAEISEIVGAPVLTVRTRLFYARRELEEMMRDEPALAQLADELARAEQEGRQAERGATADAVEEDGQRRRSARLKKLEAT